MSLTTQLLHDISLKHIGMHKFIIDNFLSSLGRIGLLLFRALTQETWDPQLICIIIMSTTIRNSTSAWALTFYIFIRYHHIPLCDVQGNHLKIIRWTWGSISSDMHLDGSHPSVAANVCMQHIPHLHCKMWTPQFRTLWSRTQSGVCRLLSLHWT